MPLPSIRGVIDRRLLVNYRADPAVVARLLPAPFRPQTINGHAVVGICLIRLRAIRPAFIPAWAGLGSENAAHRFAVAWDGPAGEEVGVYIPRRDTSSRLNVLAGGRIFPGIHHFARFAVDEQPDMLSISMHNHDGLMDLHVAGHQTTALPPTSVFGDLARASDFFAGGSLGWSASADVTVHHGLELRCARWAVEALAVDEVQSAYFDDRQRFPHGSITIDHALLMRDIAHTWHARGALRTSPACCPS
ncbi:MAG TPA: DUF2071 domain-containing protein [Planctomycetota bacterium]|jgi:hypothetical protein|nr:DUF2071 domain-containing protein [Planctomycetota bacterium]